LPMSDLCAKERQINLKDAFAVAKGSEEVLFDKIVLLVDDVFTTGNTADACAHVLKKAGAARVYVATFAIGIDRT
jgi:predicted amidophosphoribosyltransferase